MIESTALFFTLCFLWMALVGIREGSHRTFVLLFCCGVLGILSKSTTLLPVGMVVAGLVAFQLVSNFRTRAPLSNYYAVVSVAAISALVLGIGYGWVAFTDSVKAENMMAAVKLVSTELTSHNFGSLAQRLSEAFWLDKVVGRMLLEALGYLAIPSLVLIGAAALHRSYLRITLISLALFIVPLLVFTNLHLVHSYYQYANSLFVLVAVGLGIAAVIEKISVPVGLLLLVAMCVGEVAYFKTQFSHLVTADLTVRSRYKAGLEVTQHVPKTESILVLGDDWSSAIPYYGERKGVALPYWVPTPMIEALLQKPEDFFGSLPLGAVVNCGTENYGNRKDLIDAYLAQTEPVTDTKPCSLHRVTGSQRALSN